MDVILEGSILGGMDGSDAPKAEWVIKLPGGPPAKEDLARLVDADGGRDDAENSYYEAFADPDFVRIETAQRRFRGQYLRRLRRLATRDDRASSQPRRNAPVEAADASGE